MINRQELKAKGKAAFQNNYWPCVIVGMILSLAITGIVSYGGYSAHNASNEDAVTVTVAVTGILVTFISVCGYLALKPLETGGRGFFLKNSDQPAELKELTIGYQNNYFNGILTYFLRDLFIGLWTLLLIVPGIMKAYSYRMVPYILAENPNISPREALDKSSAMMDGYRMEAFKLDLSFIGWYILTALTCGLGGILFGNPYRFAADAELYKVIRNRA